MGRKVQTKQASKNKRMGKKKATKEEENKTDREENKATLSSGVSTAENAAISAEISTESVCTNSHVETVDGESATSTSDLKRKREASSELESSVEKSKKPKRASEKAILKEISIRIERW